MKYAPIDSILFIKNRKKLLERLTPNSLAIFLSNDEMPRSGDGVYPFRQNPDLFYLSGIDQERVALILYPDCPNPAYREALFIRKTNAHIAVWEGHKYTIEEAAQASGIQNIYWEDELEVALPALMAYCNNVYININENDRATPQVPSRDIRFAQQLKQSYPGHNFKRLGPIMQNLRSVKEPEELSLTRKACEITRDAFLRVLKFIKPGIAEYEIEAEIIHEFIRQRATGHAYAPIIASGKNACVLHYNENNKILRDGDLVLMDFGAEYANYAADLTRTVPANGRFSVRQKEVYNACLNIQKAGIDLFNTSLSLVEYNNEIGKITESELIRIGLLDKVQVANQNPKFPLYKKYFMHGAGHFLGIDVHDVGPRYDKIQYGNLFTIEPGIYIPEEDIGIRIENNIHVSPNGNIDLMHDIPSSIEEIEDIMNS
ncbi:MAG: aminopeptidase P N-terminal domain-containing protein [Chitinophagales bacterium]|nr:aminopeptidase P N-terminal domain-containing protein [Chitinophagales bacterium]MCZ2392558.1 aminopeptidase P N-terminal domain-containing protein [Chitinophagales bacterium]